MAAPDARPPTALPPVLPIRAHARRAPPNGRPEADVTEFGIFYPYDSVLAAYPAPDDAQRAERALAEAGVAAADVSRMSGPEALGRYGAFMADQTGLDRIKEFIAHLYGDEAGMLDDLVAMARAGAAFVLVRAPDPATTTRAVAALRASHPRVLRKYDTLTMTDLPLDPPPALATLDGPDGRRVLLA